MEKTHARDYLIEYANNLTDKDWLKDLIIETINTNGNIADDKINEIYKNLTEGNELTISEVHSNDTHSEPIAFSSLKHISGINALADNQIIRFSPNVTILHGMNGAGKSSYFRIINEMVGGNQPKRIIPNIYTETHKSVSVELKYKKESSSVDTTIEWNGENRSMPELNHCSVFDNSYLKGFLQIRNINEALVQPLGLKLFPYIVSMIDTIKSRTMNDSMTMKNQKPSIDYTNFLEDTKNALVSNNIDPRQKTHIESCYVFDDKDKKLLEDSNAKLKNLKQLNIEDKIKLLQGNKRTYESFLYDIKHASTSLTDIIREAKIYIDNYSQKKQLNEEAKKQYKVFSSIPDSNSKQWKAFIQAAHEYHPYKDGTDICPYCRQQLQTEESRLLLQAYSTFLTDKTEEELQLSQTALNNTIERVKTINTNIKISKEVKEQMVRNGITSPEQYFQDNIVVPFQEVKDNLLQCLQDKKEIEEKSFKRPAISDLTKIFQDECNKIDQELKSLNESPDKKNHEIEELECRIKQLKEKESIAQQRSSFEAWFEYDVKEKHLCEIAQRLSTADITRLSNAANEKLVTEKLRSNFVEELNALGKNNLNVELVKAASNKGKASTRLIISGTDNITDVLSEGEQKAIGLALFLAEIRSSNSLNPVILDDPVNSLDHQIARAFAERLLELPNQIIIFNHNILFLDSFECSRLNHVCKSGDTACCNKHGKHIKIYLVQDEGRECKGVIGDYKRNCAKETISEAESLLKKSPFNEHIKVSALLRKAVENCIDEVVFNGQSPTKYSSKNSRIAWGELSHMKIDTATIEKLHSIHDRVSGGKLHNGTEESENPIKVDEFRQFVTDIKEILDSHKK